MPLNGSSSRTSTGSPIIARMNSSSSSSAAGNLDGRLICQMAELRKLQQVRGPLARLVGRDAQRDRGHEHVLHDRHLVEHARHLEGPAHAVPSCAIGSATCR